MLATTTHVGATFHFRTPSHASLQGQGSASCLLGLVSGDALHCDPPEGIVVELRHRWSDCGGGLKLSCAIGQQRLHVIFCSISLVRISFDMLRYLIALYRSTVYCVVAGSYIKLGESQDFRTIQ